MRAALDRLSTALARAAAAFLRLRAWTVFGFARLEDHARERYGRSGRWLHDFAALGEGIAASPELTSALTGSDGGRPLGRVAATIVARSLSLGPGAGAAADWIAAARRLSVRELREATRRARAGAGAEAGAGAGANAGFEAGAGAGAEADADPDADRCLLRLPVPEPILAAFDEALDLHRAVQGGGTSVAEFIEALVGEAQAGGLEVGEGLLASLRSRIPEAQIEAAFRRATGAWSTLPQPVALVRLGPGATCELPSPDPLSRFAVLEERAGDGDAVELDAQIRALVRLENQLEAELGILLSGMTERREWARLQFAGVGHYAEERLGLSRSRASERTRLARALRALPHVSTACAAGRITLESASLIHRILGSGRSDRRGNGDETPDPSRREEAWVEHASATTIKRMRDEARALGRYRVLPRALRGPGTSAHSPGADADFDGTGTDRPMSDKEWYISLRREVGIAARRVQLFGFLAASISPPADPDVFHRMLPEPDSFLRLRLPPGLAGAFVSAIEAARAAVEERVASVPWDEAWPASEPKPMPASAWAARLAFARGRRVPRWVGLLALLEDFAATWDSDGAAPERRDDTIFVRDGWRCAAPGCSSRRNLEAHHVVYRSHGGSDDGWNLVTLCRFHHQCGEHGGLMRVRGHAPANLTWWLGREDVAVTFRADRVAAEPATKRVAAAPL